MSETPLSRPLAASDVPAAGRRYMIETTAQERADLAALVEIPNVAALTAELDVRPFAIEGIEVTGTIRARVTQICVVSGDAFEAEVELPVEIRFSPDGIDRFDVEASLEDLLDEEAEEAPDKLIDGRIDLGEIVTEFFALGLDPYPRKPGVAFEPPSDDDGAGPFAALASLKREQ